MSKPNASTPRSVDWNLYLRVDQAALRQSEFAHQAGGVQADATRNVCVMGEAGAANQPLHEALSGVSRKGKSMSPKIN